MRQSVIETLAGILVLVIAAGFFMFAYNRSNILTSNTSYKLLANFQNIDGIFKGSEIKLAGIKIGVVDDISIDNNTYYALLKLSIDNKIAIPRDSSAIISTSGLLGGKYININPGSDEEMFIDGGKIKFTQSALNIEDLISKLMYALTSK